MKEGDGSGAGEIVEVCFLGGVAGVRDQERGGGAEKGGDVQGPVTSDSAAYARGCLTLYMYCK